MAGPFKAVFFDFGGTLFSYRSLMPNSVRLISEAVTRLGLEMEPGPAALAYHRASQESMEALMQQPFFLHRDLFYGAFRRFAEQLGKPATDEFLDWFYEAQRSSLIESFELRSDCMETLGALHRRGLHLSIVSNVDDDFLEPMLERSELKPLLHSWTSSEEARSCKPSPEIYQVALDKTGCTPQEVVFVGDSPEQDIAGARTLGMTTVLIRDGDAPPPGAGGLEASSPHFIIDELSELADILDGAG